MEDIAIISVTGGSDFFCIFNGMLNLPHTSHISSSIISETDVNDNNSSILSIKSSVTESNNKVETVITTVQDGMINMNLKSDITLLSPLTSPISSNLSSCLDFSENKMPLTPPVKPPKLRNNING